MSAEVIDANIARWRTAVPEELWPLPAWVVWKRVPKPGKPGRYDKHPYCADGRPRCGTQGSPEDRARLVEFGDVLVAYRRGLYDGPGIAALSDLPYWFGDFDDCIDAAGNLSPLAQHVVASGTYCERSPSGRGVRAIFSGKAGLDKKNHDRGVEVFDSRGFVTVTGDSIGGESIVPCPPELLAEILAIVRAGSRQKIPSAAVGISQAPAENPALAQTVRLPMGLWRRILRPYPPGCDRSAVAFALALKLKFHGLTREQALEVMSATPCIEPAAERRGGDIASAREWLWRYVVSPAFESRGAIDGR